MRILCLTLSLYFSALAAATAETCDALLKQFEFQNKRFAMIFAEGIGDDSAERATRRELQTVNARLFQLVLLDFLRANNCTLPKQPGDMNLYLPSAMDCQNTRKRTNDPDHPDTKKACDIAAWQPTKD